MAALLNLSRCNILFKNLPILNFIPAVTFSNAVDPQTVIKGTIAKRIPISVKLEAGKKYAWCSCGLSKNQPFCDGSHKEHPLQLKPVVFTPDKTGRALLCRCKQTNNRPYCDLTHMKTFIPGGIRKALNIKL